MEQSKFYQIKNITEHEYTLVGCDGSVITRPIQDVDKSASAFTIKDAKDGDVLATKDAVFIFKHIDNAGLSLCKSYCEVIGNSKLGFGFDFSINNVHPATKEQRNTLEKAMADAGYTFDFEKKELKKIEYNHVEWHREDEQNLNTCLGYIPDEFLRRWLTDTIQIKYDKPAWSEEDEKCIRLSTDIIDSALRAGFCVQLDRDRCVDWIKSLKLQRQWKPSKEQIEALLKLEEMHVLEHERNQENAHLYMVVKSIREQLLKLREDKL